MISKAEDLGKGFPGANILVLVESPGVKKRRIVCFGSGNFKKAPKRIHNVLNFFDTLSESEEGEEEEKEE
jgi:hypothetical protein